MPALLPQDNCVSNLPALVELLGDLEGWEARDLGD